MKEFLADLHIHSVLSPCGDLEMTPRNIVSTAIRNGLDMIAITDHNSTRMCRIISDYAISKGLVVIPGAEVNTAEEVHCLALFGSWDHVTRFQIFLDQHLLNLKNDPDLFGHQVVVDKDENIIYKEERSLITGLKASIKEVELMVHQLEGLFIPAHIYRRQYGIISQLGMMPDDLVIDAVELTPGCYSPDHPNPSKAQWIFNSDAHYIDQIGKFSTRLRLKHAEFNELRLAFMNSDGRSVVGLNHIEATGE